MNVELEFRINQFQKFYAWLLSSGPRGYIPYIIPIRPNDKTPDGKLIYKRAPTNGCCGAGWKHIKLQQNKCRTICPKCGKSRGSWKQSYARLSNIEAIAHIKNGGNLAVAGRVNDPLSLIDIDCYKFYNQMPKTLTTISRKRCGGHGFVFNKSTDKIPNINTENYGEIRSQDQYVLIPGSYVPTSKEEVKKELDEGHINIIHYEKTIKSPYLGFYTINLETSPIYIDFNDLPQFFIDEFEKQKNTQPKVNPFNPNLISSGIKTKLFNLKLSDIIGTYGLNCRVSHPLHDSDTSANWCLDDSGELGHCWRHNVSLNAFQFLVVKSNYMSCVEAGSGHCGTNPSRVIGDGGALFHAWKEAKKMGLLDDKDPIPMKALKYYYNNFCRGVKA